MELGFVPPVLLPVPLTQSLLMAITMGSVMRALGLSVPRARSRPFFIASLLLSRAVPTNKWEGFTHRFRSQVWHT
jgi:hypothetical protein